MKRLFPVFSTLLVLALLLAACAPAATPPPVPTQTAAPAVADTLAPTDAPAPTDEPAPAAEPIRIVDGLGRTVTLPEPAQTVVSLAPSNTEILFAVGAGSQVIGRDDFSNYPEEAATVASIGGSMGDYNLEEITRLQPELVLATGINTPELVKSLEELGLTVFYLGNPTEIEGMFENLEIVGQLTGRETEAAALVTSLQERVQRVDDACSKPPPSRWCSMSWTAPIPPNLTHRDPEPLWMY
jgi:iron complex transport system substrate-binding protein